MFRTTRECLRTVRKPHILAFAIALLLASMAVALRFAATGARGTPQSVRRRMYADLRADRLVECRAALAWLERNDRLIAEDWMVRARIQQLQGRPDDALDSLRRIDDRDPLAAQARLMSGLIELERYRARPAELALRKASELDPGQKTARLELAVLYSRQQRFAELDAQFSALADRDQLDFPQLRFWCMTHCAPWAAGDDVEALRGYVEADAEDRSSRLALAEGLRRLGRHDEAQRLLEPLPDIDLEARVQRTQLALDQGDLERAEQLVAGGPADDAWLAQLRGQRALKAGDAASALRYFQAAYKAKPDDYITLSGLATALRQTGQDKAAEPFLAQMRHYTAMPALVDRLLAAKAATDVDLQRRLGSICEAIGRRSEARAWYRLAAASDPLDSEAQQALFRLGPAALDQRLNDHGTSARPVRRLRAFRSRKSVGSMAASPARLCCSVPSARRLNSSSRTSPSPRI
jgi:predicted Zn-dependent protease